MPFMTWQDEYSVGIESIDDQHKRLVAMINELNDAMAQGKGHQALGSIFARLVAYSRTHFGYEEELLSQHAYAGYPQQRREHAELLSKALALQEDYREGKPVISIKLMTFLKNWLSEHILGTDAKYSLFLRRRGVS